MSSDTITPVKSDNVGYCHFMWVCVLVEATKIIHRAHTHCCGCHKENKYTLLLARVQYQSITGGYC